jgi:hypothetical protein
MPKPKKPVLPLDTIREEDEQRLRILFEIAEHAHAVHMKANAEFYKALRAIKHKWKVGA